MSRSSRPRSVCGLPAARRRRLRRRTDYGFVASMRADCAHARATGPRVTAVYVSTQHTHGRPVVIVDAFATGRRRPLRNRAALLRGTPRPAAPGCVVTSITHGRRVGAGVWWLRFHTPVYVRYQISSSKSHAMVTSYWFGVSVPVGNGSAQGSRAAGFESARRRHGLRRSSGRIRTTGMSP